MAEGSGHEETTLEHTSTWAVAVVCFILIAVSILIEHGLHLLAKYLQRKRKKYVLHVLSKIKSDLLLLGFISLMLTVGERPLAKICIPKGVVETFLPCQSLTSEDDEESKCQEQGKMSFMSREGAQQLQMLIFVLAFVHVLSSFLTFSLGMAKMRRWESWEAETRTMEYQFSNDPRRFQLIHQTTFGRRHLRFWSEYRILRLPVVFFRQFFNSVSKVDYITLRRGFVAAHCKEKSSFDFQKYLRRALEKDFGVVIGMSLCIWIFSVLFIFFNAYVFHSYIWLPFIPLLFLLAVGTKLQAIITRMCLDTNDKSHVIRGSLLVRPSDHFFWFDRPELLLHLMHFILFQNSFQLAFFSWTWYKFGLRSCFHRQTEDIVIRLTMGVLVQFLCGYVTLPLYALVTQMGTSTLRNAFPEAVVRGLKRWRAKARKKIARRSHYAPSLDASLDASLTSLSFSTLDASLSVELGYAADESIISTEIEDEDTSDSGKQMEKVGSFEGLDMGRMQQF
ncbi:MLO-like protein 6 [Coffea arabica]|uniref:MLO-like protein n=1 Tax=Coffea arabica TaxID=13443 RepID=A0A6P6W9A1_COFAR|nr:MLO-like protein 6 isoform X2 [Coffea arabica]